MKAITPIIEDINKWRAAHNTAIMQLASLMHDEPETTSVVYTSMVQELRDIEHRIRRETDFFIKTIMENAAEAAHADHEKSTYVQFADDADARLKRCKQPKKR